MEVVNEKTRLSKRGTEWKGLCPFHEEQTPSFSVDDQQNLYHCFGCDVGGDAIRFVMETESLEFQEAVEQLAARYDVELINEGGDLATRKRRKLYALLNRVAEFYGNYLWASPEAARAKRYLLDRGLTEETLKEFRIGYAPTDLNRVTVNALNAGYNSMDLSAVGLSQRSREGRWLDRFRGRIMFPLADERGRTIGFGARASAGTDPKYLNTSATELYHKGRFLYGMNRARKHAIRSGRVIVVEGYTDVLALHQAGIRESVAIMGTSLTQEQLLKLSRVATQVTLALDADKAGDIALERIVPMANNRGLKLSLVKLPTGRDPAELIEREGPVAFEARLEDAEALVQVEEEAAPVPKVKTPEQDLSAAAKKIRSMHKGLKQLDEELRVAAHQKDLSLINALTLRRRQLRRKLEETMNADS